MNDNVFTDAFLDAMGAWQRGWKEEPDRRKELTSDLLKAIGETSLPAIATTADGICYRKRFLYQENPENGGDHVPILIGGRDEEGVASWSTEFEWLKTFKGEIRHNCQHGHLRAQARARRGDPQHQGHLANRWLRCCRK